MYKLLKFTTFDCYKWCSLIEIILTRVPLLISKYSIALRFGSHLMSSIRHFNFSLSISEHEGDKICSFESDITPWRLLYPLVTIFVIEWILTAKKEKTSKIYLILLYFLPEPMLRKTKLNCLREYKLKLSWSFKIVDMPKNAVMINNSWFTPKWNSK